MQFNLLTFSDRVVRALFGLNVLFAVVFLLLLSWWSVAPTEIEAALVRKYGGGSAGDILGLIRMALALGALASIPAGLMLATLSRMIRTVREGTPFISANARRLRIMAWLVLILQLVDVAFGLLGSRAAAIEADWVGWSPSVMGWLMVLLLFVLARIFETGVAMRDDLEGTV